jgi:PTS system mannose-specific IIA component
VSAHRALVVTHGDLAAALVGAVEGFLGPQSGFDPVSNDALSIDDLRLRIEGAVADGAGSLIVFTDMMGGSCDSAARLAARGRPIVVVSGVNLPMLVEFCHYRERMGVDELVARVARKGSAGIEVTTGDNS